MEEVNTMSIIYLVSWIGSIIIPLTFLIVTFINKNKTDFIGSMWLLVLGIFTGYIIFIPVYVMILWVYVIEPRFKN